MYYSHLSLYMPTDKKGHITQDCWRPSYSESGEIPTPEGWQQIVEHVNAFYAKTNREDIVRHNENLQAEHIAMNERRPAKEPIQNKSGWIYIIRAGEHYKIGRAQKPIDRYSQIATLPPWPTEVVHTFEVEDYCLIEKDLHDLFANKRTNGEWFTLTEEDVTWLKTL